MEKSFRNFFYVKMVYCVKIVFCGERFKKVMAEKVEEKVFEHSKDISYEDFEKKIFDEMEKIDKQKHFELNKLDEETCAFMTIFNKKHSILRDKLESFYEEKRLTIRRILRETKMFKDVQARTYSKMFQNDVTNMMDMVNYSLDNFILKKAVYEKSKSLHNFDIGKVIIPSFEKPFKETLILLEEKPRKIIANSNNFFLLDHNGLVTNLTTNDKIFYFKNSITDITTAYNDDIGFMEQQKKNIIKIYLIENSKKTFETFKLSIKEDKIHYERDRKSVV